ncbi:hypothetical protein D3C73_1483270 [compost metagenome]
MCRQRIARSRVRDFAYRREPIMPINGALAAFAAIRSGRKARNQDGAVQAGQRIQRPEDKGGLPCPVSAAQALTL